MVTAMRAGPIIQVTVGDGTTTAIVMAGITRTRERGTISIGELMPPTATWQAGR